MSVKRIGTYTLIAVFFGLAVMATLSQTSGGQTTGGSTERQIAQGATEVVEILRVGGGVIGFVVGGIGVWILFRASMRKHHLEAAEKTAEIYEDQNKALQQQLTAKDEKIRLLEKENTVLSARTDISAVLQVMKEAVGKSNERWDGLMECLNAQEAANATSLKVNFDLLTSLVKNIGLLTRRFAAIESKMDEAIEHERRVRNMGPPDGRERRRQ